MTALHTENLAIASDTPGISLHLRHKRRADIAQFGPERTVLLMHGATLPAESLFDVPVGQGAFMDVLAEAGFDVYALNVRGFGASTRPAEMEGAPDAAPPQVRTEVAVRDLGAAVAHILAAHALPQLVLIGMSWGGTVTGAYTAAHPEHIAKLVLIAPQWLSDGPPRIDSGGPLQAYRRFDVRAFRARWLESVPPHRHDEILPPAWFERWVNIMLAGDPAENQGIIRAPAGVIQDVRQYWAVGLRPGGDHRTGSASARRMGSRRAAAADGSALPAPQPGPLPAMGRDWRRHAHGGYGKESLAVTAGNSGLPHDQSGKRLTRSSSELPGVHERAWLKMLGARFNSTLNWPKFIRVSSVQGDVGSVSDSE